MKRNKRETVGISDIYDICDALNDLQSQISDNTFIFSASILGLCAAGLYLTYLINKLEAKIEEMQENKME